MLLRREAVRALAGVKRRLLHPVPDRLGRGLKFAPELLGRSAMPDAFGEFDVPRCIPWQPFPFRSASGRHPFWSRSRIRPLSNHLRTAYPGNIQRASNTEENVPAKQTQTPEALVQIGAALWTRRIWAQRGSDCVQFRG